MAVEEGSAAPAVALEGTEGTVQVPDPQGRPLLLMFFQEAGTPLCSAQVTAVAAERETIAELGAEAVCVSVDPIERLRAFSAGTVGGNVKLASDPDGSVARAFGVYDEHEKRAQRAAFVIGGDGTVQRAIPFYNPSNSTQFAALFEALGLANES